MWETEGGGTILKYDLPTFKKEESSVVSPIEGFRYVRLRIDNQDNPPLRVSTIEAYGYRKRAFFPYQAGSEYQIYSETKTQRPPSYDLETIFQYLPSRKAPVLTRSDCEESTVRDAVRHETLAGEASHGVMGDDDRGGGFARVADSPFRYRHQTGAGGVEQKFPMLRLVL